MNTSKAIAGGILAGLTSTGATAATVIPAGTPMPWWGYLVTFVVTSVIGYAGVYFAPRNTN